MVALDSDTLGKMETCLGVKFEILDLLRVGWNID